MFSQIDGTICNVIKSVPGLPRSQPCGTMWFSALPHIQTLEWKNWNVSPSKLIQMLIHTSESVSEGLKNSFTLESNSIQIYSENECAGSGSRSFFGSQLKWDLLEGHNIFIEERVLAVWVKTGLLEWFFIANKCPRLRSCHPFVWNRIFLHPSWWHLESLKTRQIRNPVFLTVSQLCGRVWPSGWTWKP